MLAATQVEFMNAGLAMFVFAGLATFIAMTATRLYLKIHNTIGGEGKAFYFVISGILILVCIIGTIVNTRGCSPNNNIDSGMLVIRTGVDPDAPPVTLIPEPLNIPVRLEMTPTLTQDVPVPTATGESE